jgi:hypothetical protein
MGFTIVELIVVDGFRSSKSREPSFPWFQRQSFPGGEALSLPQGGLGFDAELKG